MVRLAFSQISHTPCRRTKTSRGMKKKNLVEPKRNEFAVVASHFIASTVIHFCVGTIAPSNAATMIAKVNVPSQRNILSPAVCPALHRQIYYS